ncbi:MAG: ribose 5-phosphate isomerase B [Solitalea-like symbiont of Tyrophagus putrescentiae]
MSKLKLVIGSDHAGYSHSEYLYNYLKNKDCDVLMVGATNSYEAYNYPDAAKKVAKLIQEHQYDYGILLCGTGIGMSIQANRHIGVRAALCNTKEIAALSREHNDANILCLAARFINIDTVTECVEAFLSTPFLNNEKYLIRIKKLDDI